MLSTEEMRALLLREYGIKNDADLDRELRMIGGIKVAVFTDDFKAATI
jgi:hypothetical protein